MSNPRVRFTSGRQPAETLTVDYRDVLEQAVANERWRVLREVRRAVEAVATRRTDKFDSWRTDPRSAEEVKTDVLKVLDRLEVSDD